jgi:hypothetical protein
MADFNNHTEQKIDISVSDTVAEGTYANLAIITHSNSEFILDFVNIMPGMTKGNVKSRIILTPQHAKRLLLALQDNLQRFESYNGEIHVDSGPVLPPMNFGGSQGQA